MDEDVNGVGMIRSIKSELLDRVRRKMWTGKYAIPVF
jgi:hypothetical protein